LKLGAEYNITPWIVALLDNAPIEIGSKEQIKTTITSPPKYTMDKNKLFPPPELTSSTPSRSRAKRSASPAKVSATPRKIASPRKRAARGNSAKPDETADGAAKLIVPKPSQAPTEKAGHGRIPTTNGNTKDDTVRVEVEETVETNKATAIETVRTSVTVAMPASHPDLPIPDSTEGVIEKAKGMVEEAQKLEQTKAKTSRKRKASGNVSKEDVAAAQPAPKRARTGLEERLVSERARNRALVGLTATLAIGYEPYLHPSTINASSLTIVKTVPSSHTSYRLLTRIKKAPYSLFYSSHYIPPGFSLFIVTWLRAFGGRSLLVSDASPNGNRRNALGHLFVFVSGGGEGPTKEEVGFGDVDSTGIFALSDHAPRCSYFVWIAEF
jgi:hypothetical protein